MAVSPKIIRRRIKSVASTKKITKAMELVDAAKMRKAVVGVLASRPYATLAWSLVHQLTGAAGNGDETHPLLAPRAQVRKTLAVLFTSDRGLCGGFNAQVLRQATEAVAQRPAGSVEFAVVGRRGESWLRRRGLPVAASFEGLLQSPSAARVRPMAKLVSERFLSGACDEVLIIYNDYISALLQKPRVKTLLPLKNQQKAEASGGEYLFEPDPQAVLNALLPRIVESQLFQALLESKASEHSARMLAMRNATDSASEMLDDLNFTYNQARQAGITREIAEISAGTAAIAG